MAVNTMPQKRYDYYINGTKLTKDPKGWDEHSIGITRSEDFGLNVEVVVPLSFSGNGRDILKSIYESDSIFSNATLTIYKRGNDWQMEEFYTYRLDFSTYKDNLNIQLKNLDKQMQNNNKIKDIINDWRPHNYIDKIVISHFARDMRWLFFCIIFYNG